MFELYSFYMGLGWRASDRGQLDLAYEYWDLALTHLYDY